VLIGWIIGVPLDIWWPRPASPDHPSLARAYRLVRSIAACLLASFCLYIAVVLVDQLIPSVGLAAALGLASGLGAFMLSPLATCASALDVQRRGMAIIGTYCAALFTAGQTWFSFSLLLDLLANPLRPHSPFWWKLSVLVSTGLAAVSLVLALELYVMIRHPQKD